MTDYEERKLKRAERLRERAARLREFASTRGFDQFKEENSGIPLGQPILVGHHSEGRHRRHLERMHKRLDAGMRALKLAEKLEERAAAAESRRAIDSDNPDAMELLRARIKELEAKRDRWKETNALVRKAKDAVDLAHLIAKAWPDVSDPDALAEKLLTPDFAGRIGIPAYALTNLGAEIRRLKGRLGLQGKIERGVEPFSIGDITVHYEAGRIIVRFPWKPDAATREKLKRAPLALKWSPTLKAWVRKHTSTTLSEYFNQELRRVLQEVHDDSSRRD